MAKLSPSETTMVIEEARMIVIDSFDGILNAAATHADMPQQTLYRLLNKPPDQMQWRTFERLWGLDRKRNWESMVMTSQARVVLLRYQRWLNQELESRTWAVGIIGRLDKGEAPSLEMEQFRKWAQKRGVDENRIELGIRRAFDFPKSSLDAGGLERQWGELSATERRSYLRHGLAREMILLRRLTEMDRARKIYATPAERATSNAYPA